MKLSKTINILNIKIINDIIQNANPKIWHSARKEVLERSKQYFQRLLQ